MTVRTSTRPRGNARARASRGRRPINRWGSVLPRLGAALAVSAVLASGREASANGRYPLANQLVVDPSTSSHLVARTTFGVLESTDSGGTWTWICENAIGYFGVEDPPIAVTTEGTILVASSGGLSASRDRGCSWTVSETQGAKRFGIDVTALPTHRGEALAIVSSYVDGGYVVHVTKTEDDGMTWRDLGDPLPGDFLATTIEVAPANPDRIYVSGKVTQSARAAVARSDDGGLTWTRALLDPQGPVAIYIGAVDPIDPDVIYLRTKTDEGGHVLVSRDAAATFREVWSAPDEVLGFALSGDGSTIAVGGKDSGVSLASTTDFAFRKTNGIESFCLAWSGPALVACAIEAIDHFSIGVSHDRGETFSALLTFPDITPRRCDPGTTTGTICGDYWGVTAATIGADAGSSDDASPTASDGGSSRGPIREIDAGGGAHGCTCKLARVNDTPGPEVLLGASLALALGLRRRDRHSSAKMPHSTTSGPQTTAKTAM